MVKQIRSPDELSPELKLLNARVFNFSLTEKGF